ncbi:MAG: segregation/condensation protein A [Bdellovibrionales bacterium]|nr:segregation/condensation protein A [Bdellovibrionales bacterium]
MKKEPFTNLETSFVFKLNDFSGPLDLLLQLVKDNKMDIFKINVSQITDQYVNYLKHVFEPDLNRAGDFIKMATWLLYLKSKSLIPEDKKQDEEPDLKEFQQKLSLLLIVYQKFKKLAQFLASQNILGRDCWKSVHSFQFKVPKETKIERDEEKGMLLLAQAYYNKKLEYQKRKKNYKILEPTPSLLHHLKETLSFFKLGVKLKFSQLILLRKTPYSFLLSFLSLLELSKFGFVNLFQKTLFSNIDIVVKKQVTSHVLTEIESKKQDENLSKEL